MKIKLQDETQREMILIKPLRVHKYHSGEKIVSKYGVSVSEFIDLEGMSNQEAVNQFNNS